MTLAQSDPSAMTQVVKERLQKDFERALTSKLDEALKEFPAEFLNMKLRDFLALASIPKFTTDSYDAPPETPKTAAMRSNRHPEHSLTATSSASTIKATPGTRGRKVLMTPQAFNPLLPQTPANYAQNIAAKRPRLTIKAATPAKGASEEEIVQFQLNSGKIVDVDFSKAPEAALADAQLMESADALQEVKAKIETYASHFMQYLKFFKKLQPKKK